MAILKMKKKLLSLCFPTYNRGWCMKKQIDRLMLYPKDLLDKIEIIISDNCSTDDTQQIIESALQQGFECRYIRQTTNIGADPNFVCCLRNASGRYVWLLGDDDILIVDSLFKIIEILDVEKEYGLLHMYQREGLDGKILFIDNKELVMKYTSYYITFISANIVNAKYISSINFEDYFGTWLMYLPLYLTSIQRENNHIIIGSRIFSESKDYLRNGGYNYFEVFVHNYLTIMAEYIKDNELYIWLKKDIWSLVWGNAKKMLVKKETGNYSTENAWRIIAKYYANEWYAWITWISYPFIVLKRKIKLFYQKIMIRLKIIKKTLNL